ncbi:MAG: 4a-hydroxytetrahydrobiopterin dehydratase [Cyanobacteria bacterium P01_F01_bin.33]
MRTIFRNWWRTVLSLGVAIALLLLGSAFPEEAWAETGPRVLSSSEVQQRLVDLPEWAIVDEKLHRKFEFDSFVEAFGWMSSIALVAESLGHHPEWFNVYNRVTVDLTTHDVSGISDLDFELATRMNELAE